MWQWPAPGKSTCLPLPCLRACLPSQDVVGSFEVGKDFDALLVDVHAARSPFDIFDGEDDMQALEKFLNLGDDRNLVEVWVEVRCAHVHCTAQPCMALPFMAVVRDCAHTTHAIDFVRICR